jgi:hypothetical protein
MAMQKGFNPQDTRMMSVYLGMADSFGVSREDAMKILTEERGTEIERAKIKSTATDSGDFGFAEGETWVDTQGNYYAQGTRRNKQTGKYETVFDPITPGAPDMPVGKLTPVMPGTMETSEERVGRELETAEGKAQLDITKATTIETAKNFDQQKTKASDRLPTVLDTLDKVDAMLQIVDGLETGSTLAQMSDLVQTALGYRETDMGIFQTAAKELLVGRITSFGSNPSDGERNAIVEMLPNIQNTPAINRAVLEMTKGRLAKERMAINYIQRPGITREDYVKFVDSLYPPSESTTGKPGVDPVTGNQVVDFNDIP